MVGQVAEFSLQAYKFDRLQLFSPIAYRDPQFLFEKIKSFLKTYFQPAEFLRRVYLSQSDPVYIESIY